MDTHFISAPTVFVAVFVVTCEPVYVSGVHPRAPRAGDEQAVRQVHRTCADTRRDFTGNDYMFMLDVLGARGYTMGARISPMVAQLDESGEIRSRVKRWNGILAKVWGYAEVLRCLPLAKGGDRVRELLGDRDLTGFMQSIEDALGHTLQPLLPPPVAHPPLEHTHPNAPVMYQAATYRGAYVAHLCLEVMAQRCPERARQHWWSGEMDYDTSCDIAAESGAKQRVQ
jgi:hypothetical protein